MQKSSDPLCCYEGSELHNTGPQMFAAKQMRKQIFKMRGERVVAEQQNKAQEQDINQFRKVRREKLADLQAN